MELENWSRESQLKYEDLARRATELISWSFCPLVPNLNYLTWLNNKNNLVIDYLLMIPSVTENAIILSSFFMIELMN